MTKTKTQIILKRFPKIDNRLRHYRKLKGYTQSEVAKILDVNQGNISNWEQGIKYPGLVNALKLSILYRRFLAQLFEIQYLELCQGIRDREDKLTSQTHE